jgi:cytochrome c peroxidase
MRTLTIVSLLLALAALPSFTSDPGPTDTAQLGEMLFHDPILSSDRSISCASCHIPAFGFADTAVLSRGVGGQLGSRNTPAVTNMTSREHFFWDGRAATLEQQVAGPIQNPVEMNLPLSIAVERLREHPNYKKYFKHFYGHKPDSASLTNALATFMRTLETSDTPFDDWMQGDRSAMSAAAVRGRQVFMKKGKCFDCHFSPDFTGDEFRNIGLYDGEKLNDAGRFAVTRKESDKGKFKVPGLRNVAVTAPYMHNGQFKTLKEVIDYYDQPDNFGIHSIGRDTLLQRPLGLTATEKTDLEAFLEALTDRRFK